MTDEEIHACIDVMERVLDAISGLARHPQRDAIARSASRREMVETV